MRDWKYCPRCSAELERLGDDGNPYVRCPECGFVKYNNPLPSTIGIIRRGEEYLFLRRTNDPQKGKWDAVGGFLAPGERAEDCLIREAEEEIGCTVTDIRVIGTYASVYGSTGLETIGIAFLCSLAPGDDIRLSPENDAYAWFRTDRIPELAFDDVRKATSDALDIP
ncbi:NUDIX hydrolase [Phytohabitans sp. ZYX-F-186]|uniref:NUDIX hydrolase n=1 Tax=Phytohabitans maris TaxID=3071409 RepID=A0ABU0ZAM4_9ACTN|nr:NUDIX hydrolase [Phytohabitans sp. ZYX-F-186]MDQ7904114.1 NUDIX hydrolase [Phytohabitans sp. ZYX-F-186]